MKKRQEIQQKSRLGTLLVHKGLITRQQLDEALTLQAQLGLRLGEILTQKGWLSEKQLNNALRNQTRYRLVAALGAVLLAPLQPFMISANAAENPVVSSEQFIQRGGMKPLSEQDMSGVAGQGANNYERLLDIVNNSLSGEDSNSGEKIAISTLENLASSLIPGTNLLESDVEISGVQYEPGPRTTINSDGSLDLQLPSNIKQIAFRNVRVAGAEGQHMGDVVIRDLSFGADTSVKIYLH